VILFLGRLHKRKGVEVLVRAFEGAKLKDTWLMLAGPDEGMMTKLAGIAGKRVLFTGHLEGQTRLQALSGADVFVLPAVGEGLSMASLEALASGIPVILSPGCNLPQAEMQGAGLIVPPEIDPLAKAMTELVNDPALRANMSRNAQLWAREAFSWSGIAEQMVKVYEGIVS
jgi:glycosyltransferase involved in cell wall biosynthesis